MFKSWRQGIVGFLVLASCQALPRPTAICGQDVVFLQKAPLPLSSESLPVVCWHESWQTPRPVHVYFLKIDLESSEYEVLTLLSEDPDGNGPAEARLEKPERLALSYQVVAAVNANAFRSLPDVGGNRDTEWFEGKPVDIIGLAASDRSIRSRISPERTAFWLDLNREAHIGNPDKTDTILHGISGWACRLLDNGEIVPEMDNVFHPRTILGLDESGRWLILAVVDGRREGYSEGISLYEAADMMKNHGCHDAINLDGGGSTIMLAVSDRKLRAINRPSGDKRRPIPVMIGVRRRAESG